MKKDKKKFNWTRTLKNNVYMLGLIRKACPVLMVTLVTRTVLNVAREFLMTTYLYQYALNALINGTEIRQIVVKVVGLIIFSICSDIVNDVIYLYEARKRPLVTAYIQGMLQTKAAQADLACFEDPDFYDTYVKATREASDLPFNVLNNVRNMMYSFLYIGAVVTLIATIDPIFILLALIPLLHRLLLGSRCNRIQYEYNMENEEVARKRDYVRRTFYLNDFSKEMRLTGMWRVMFGRMRESVAEMKELVDRYGYKLMWYNFSFDLVMEWAVYIGSIALAGFKTLVKKTMLVGDCFVVLNGVSSIAQSAGYLGNFILRLDEHSMYIGNVCQFLDYEIQITEDENAPEAPVPESLELKAVSFRYRDGAEPVLKNINLAIRAGEKIAIVGHNGAGKTTLVKLLQRFYDPSEGEICLNGEDIRQFRLSTYRNRFGTVFQDYGLFATTVAENVMLRGNITDEDRERVRDALIRSGINEKIEKLPHGMDTMVTKEFDPEGAVFSGGEAQKISIARIFAGNQEIVIMDEPTSALDPIAEQEMYRNMFEACEGKTVIFISHRLSSATMADRVYLFEHGEIVEQGSHRELLLAGGKYADMWHKQADTYTDSEEVAG